MEKKKTHMLECGIYHSSSRELGIERQESLLSGIKGTKKVQQVIRNSISASILPPVCLFS